MENRNEVSVQLGQILEDKQIITKMIKSIGKEGGRYRSMIIINLIKYQKIVNNEDFFNSNYQSNSQVLTTI